MLDVDDPKEAQGDYGALIAAFVALHAHNARQRTTGWLAKKARMIGGSEIAALMGLNPYSSFEEVVAAKVGVGRFTGNIACRWGTLFEGVIEAFVALDCGTALHGTDVSIPAPPGSGLEGLHANSPDGYAEVVLYLDPEGAWRLATTDPGTVSAAAGRPSMRAIALLEFKCPFRRRPKGAVPRHYLPQVWSGLALSPIAHYGLFVDAVFRKCAFWSLGPRAGYDRTYHREPLCADWTAPIAWGLTAVYAPRLDAPRPAAAAPWAGEEEEAAAAAAEVEAALGGGGDDGAAHTDPGYEAWLLHYKAFGLPYASPEEAARTHRPFCPAPVDFGDCEAPLFETAMVHVDSGAFPTKHVGPCTPDGRGPPLQTGREMGAAVDALAGAPPPGHFLLGIIPWKLLEVDYCFVERRPGFLEEVRPLVIRALQEAATFRAAPDPAGEFYAHVMGLRASRGRKGGAVGADELQDLFDAASPRNPEGISPPP